jgi:AraC family transcriptional activator FtrA
MTQTPYFAQFMPRRFRSSLPRSPRVVALAYDGLCTFEFGIVVEVFGLHRPEMGESWYRFAVATEEGKPCRATGGIRMIVDGGLELLSSADLVVLPGWPGLDEPVSIDLAKALRAVYARGGRIVSICSGAFALAEIGLLDNKRATTHWLYMDRFVERFPKVRIERDVLYVDEGQVMTSAGSAAGIDLCLHIVRKDYGAVAANMVARRMVMPPHRDGGQLQFVEQPVPTAYEGGRLSPLIGSLFARLHKSLSVNVLAREAKMSTRTFVRRFTAATGLPPGKWIAQQRVRLAKSLLEATDESVEVIASRCGFGDVSSLRRQFSQQVGVSPVQYRSRFTLAKPAPTATSGRGFGPYVHR